LNVELSCPPAHELAQAVETGHPELDSALVSFAQQLPQGKPGLRAPI
jgi:hypothetical protein